MKLDFVYRMVILVIVGACFPILITTVLNHYFDLSFKKAMEYTLILCIPIAVWMAIKINERWHDDQKD